MTTPIRSWTPTAGGNNQTPPFGAPEGGLALNQVSDTFRQTMATIRQWFESAEWIDFGHVPTFVSGTSFTVTDDKRAIYHVGRRVRATNASAAIVVGTITASSYSSPTTSVTVTWDTGAMDSALAEVAVGSASAVNQSIGASAVKGLLTSVGISVPSFLTVSNNPLTANGTIAIAAASLPQSQFLATPTAATGPVAARSIASGDLPTADTSSKGAVQIATASEVQTGTDTSKAVTPATLASAGGLPKGILVIDGTPGTPTVISASGIAAGVTLSKPAAGQVAITLTTARAAAKSPVVVSASTSNAGSAGVMQSPAPTANALTVYTTTVSGSSIFYSDSNFITVLFY